MFGVINVVSDQLQPSVCMRAMGNDKKNDRTKCVEQTEQPLKNVCLRNVFQAYQGEHNLDNKANERKKLEDITEH